MIQQIVISIPRTRGDTDLEIRVLWLAQQLIRDQVIAKIGYAVVPHARRLEMVGVLAYHHDGLDVLASAPVKRSLKNTEIASDGLHARVTPAVGFDESDAYCGPRARGDLTLMCDVITGMPPLRLAESGAYVASHRLRLSDETATALWMWDEQYRHVYLMWLGRGGYEGWALRELSRRDSVLNTAGRAVARRIAKDCGRRVRTPALDAFAGR